MAGCYTTHGTFFDVDSTLAAIVGVLEEHDLPHGVRGALEDIVEDFRCEACCGVITTGHEGPGICACDDDW